MHRFVTNIHYLSLQSLLRYQGSDTPGNCCRILQQICGRKTGISSFSFPSADLILHVVTQEEVSTDRVGNVQRIKPTFGAFVRHSTVAV